MAEWKRFLMVWELYDGTMVEMYINPQQVTFNHTKKITSTRTKGGFVVQYWGDELDTMQISGTTGSAGIEAIEVLYDIYRSEQLSDSRLIELKKIGLRYNKSLKSDKSQASEDQEKYHKSDLVSRATQVTLWYGNKRYYGFFTNFNITESATSPGEYLYTINYTIWKTKGRDVNYMPWHRSAQGELTFPSSVKNASDAGGVIASGNTNTTTAPPPSPPAYLDPNTAPYSPPSK